MRLIAKGGAFRRRRRRISDNGSRDTAVLLYEEAAIAFRDRYCREPWRLDGARVMYVTLDEPPRLVLR